MSNGGKSSRGVAVMVRSMASFVSSGCGSGYSPKAPGTIGSIAAVLAWMLAEKLGLFLFISPTLMAIVVGVAGLVASIVVMKGDVAKDPQWIVIDEWAGLFVALCGVDPQSVAQILVALLGFRVFDICKPGPVRWAERLPGAYGVMADDIVAGAIVYLGFVAYGYI